MTDAQALHACYLLHATKYRETSLIGHFLTRDLGLVRAVVRGGRQAKRMDNRPQPFNLGMAQFGGRGELRTVWRYERQRWYRLVDDALVCALYCNEITLALLPPMIAHPLLFDTYEQTLAALMSTVTVMPQWALRLYELCLLRESGYGIDLQYDIHGDAITVDQQYRYAPGRGFMPNPPVDGVTIAGTTIRQLATCPTDDGEITAAAKRQARNLLRAALHWRLNGRPLYTRTLLTAARTPLDTPVVPMT